MTRAFNIAKQRVLEAYRRVKLNAGSAGIDQVSLEDFEENLKDNLYKIWNRLSSGSYFPPPVMAVEIPKKLGGVRVLGIPTVSDRIAQMVVKLSFEGKVEPYFLEDSYGYRPHKSALDAISITRKRCWSHKWVLEFDIKGLFDNIPHDLLMKAVVKHTKDKWVILYIKRWLTSPIALPNGILKERNKGTPQGGIISPILANLFLHYAFDKWMSQNHPDFPWCRYADDGLVHCHSESEALAIRKALAKRFEECGLQLHPDKTKVVHCKRSNSNIKFHTIQFDFLGYTFRPRKIRSRYGKVFVGFTPAVSKSASKAMRDEIRSWNLKNRSGLTLKGIAKRYNPVIRGWIQYYAKYSPSSMKSVWIQFNSTIIRWMLYKYKKINGKRKAVKVLKEIQQSLPNLFPHWQLCYGKCSV